MTSSCLFSLRRSATHHGWQSISACFCSLLFIHSAKMIRQNVSVASFLGGFSTHICSLSRFLKNFFLLFANIFTFFCVTPDSLGFCLNSHFEGFSYCLQFLVCCYFIFLFNSLFSLGDLLGLIFLCHVC